MRFPLLRADSCALAIVLNRIDSLKYTKPAGWRVGVNFLRRVEQRLRDGGAE